MTFARTLCLCLLAGAGQAQSPEALRTMVRQSLRNLQEADRKLADYAYARYNVRREFHSDGSLKTEKRILARRDFEDGFGFMHDMQRNGETVPEAERKQAREWARARAAELRAMSPAERERAEPPPSRAEEQSWLREFPDALDYRKVGEETIGGRRTLVLEYMPHPGYKASSARARVFSKLRGKIWLDAAEAQIVRVDAEVYETVNIGWGVVGKVYQGTRFHAERRRFADGMWLPESQKIRFAARFFMFKSLSQEEITQYSEFRHKSALSARAE